jgi:putative intracellular protease/amidase
MFCTLVCHGPGALRYTMASNGRPLVADKSVTGFSNLEEAASELTDVVPFLVEDMLRNQLFPEREVATLCRLRWRSDHGTKSGILGSRCQRST